MSKCFLGTELKLNIRVEPMQNLHLKDYDFDVEIYTSSPSKGIKMTKRREGDSEIIDGLLFSNPGDPQDSYIALVDTALLGIGKVKCKVTAYIPDDDFGGDSGSPVSTRTEVDIINTGIEIIKGI